MINYPTDAIPCDGCGLWRQILPAHMVNEDHPQVVECRNVKCQKPQATPPWSPLDADELVRHDPPCRAPWSMIDDRLTLWRLIAGSVKARDNIRRTLRALNEPHECDHPTCKESIHFCKTQAGNYLPVNADGMVHFADCPGKRKAPRLEKMS